MRQEKPTVGQTVWALNAGKAARHAKQELKEWVVSKVGNKYFYARPPGGSDWAEQRFCLDDWSESKVGGYSADTALYSSVKEYDEENEEREIVKLCREAFDYCNSYNVPICDLRLIRKIIQDSKEAKESENKKQK